MTSPSPLDLPANQWHSMATAPKSGLIDLLWCDRRYIDCYWDSICAEYRTIDTSYRLIIVKSPTHWRYPPASPLDSSIAPLKEEMQKSFNQEHQSVDDAERNTGASTSQTVDGGGAASTVQEPPLGIASAEPKPIAKLVILMDTHDMGQSLAPNPPFKSHRIMVTDWEAAQALPLGTYQLTLETPRTDGAFVRDLLWSEQPECCGNPVVGATHMGEQEQLCCGCPEPAMLNDAQIVATLRARFPNV